MRSQALDPDGMLGPGSTILCFSSTMLAAGSLATFYLTELAIYPVAACLVLYVLGLAVALGTRGWLGYLSTGEASCLFTTVFATNVVITLVVYGWLTYAYGTPYLPPGINDDFEYVVLAKEALSVAGLRDYSAFAEALPRIDPAYYYLVAATHWAGEAFGGFHTLVPRFINSAGLGMIALLVVYAGMATGAGRGSSLRAGMLTGLFPLFAYWGSVVVRDVLIVLLVLCVFVAAVAALQERVWQKAFGWFVIATLATLALWAFRRESAVATVLGLLGGLVLEGTWSRRRGTALITVTLVVAGTIGLWGPALASKLELLRYFDFRRFGTSGGDSISATLSALPVPVNLLFKVLYGLIAPLPTLSSDPLATYRGLGTLLWIFLAPFALFGILKSFGKRTAWLSAMFGVFLLGTTLTSFQTRHFMQWLPFGFLLGFVGLEDNRKAVLPIVGLVLLAFAIAGAMYVLVKGYL